MLQDILIEGLIYSVMVLGVFTSYRILGFCDMTTDGSFPLGACVLAMCLTHGINSVLAIPLVIIAGALAGVVTTMIYDKLKIPDLLAGILTMTMLYSVNLRLMGGRANVSFLKIPTAISNILDIGKSILGNNSATWLVVGFLIIVVLIIKFALDLFFHTDLGLCIGALGSNRQMILSQGINPRSLTLVGITLGNALCALSGALSAQYMGFADVGSGTGIIVSGLASLMLGEFIIHTNKIGYQTLRVILGSILYRALMFIARNYGYHINLTANDLKLINGILIILCLVVSRYKGSLNIKRHSRLAPRGGK